MNKRHETAGAELITPIESKKPSYWTSLMPKIGLALMLIGFIMSCCFAYEFKDTNLGLMVGFGFIIGGTQVLLLGSLFHALQPKVVKESSLPAVQSLDQIQP
ncbi:hypothetical protein [Paenibacillus sp. R14(2021)]|uniref:hypothetical protein n=1 Tax=Paenibacillus sp. R14(2021) TaxID=2859228 RepID=UPI001C6134F4|nr:hypothetical protein [Paenibacillus sp. R14(2021)]